jgi:hypothetical protein
MTNYFVSNPFLNEYDGAQADLSPVKPRPRSCYEHQWGHISYTYKYECYKYAW